MTSDKSIGRWFGGLLLVAMVLGIWNNFGLSNPVFSGRGYLHNGAGMAHLFGASVLMALFTAALGLAATVIAWPLFRRTSPGLALAGLVLTGIGFATTVGEQASFMSMLSLSQQYAQHPGADPLQFELMRGVVSAARNWIHYLDKIVGGAGLLVTYVLLFRGRLVPRIISVLGVAAVLSQMGGISLELFQRDLPMLMLAPLALMQLVLCLWLLARGFATPAVKPATGSPLR
ncbi:MAG: DUF4386 domain-containing protein [Arenimonas sp.]|uniref:DUF4386 domain-containing protein n=1 Tax=Arenimonas sp. TaxID=1872635 RepID=UPI0025C51FB7|nr:DUF4386 domain-containing protein [Arenimonas sp.]MBW8367374.1 DUF4386 domain-containing protein [Arenimonas sp.]